MLSHEQWRELLGHEHLSEAEVSEFVTSLRNFLSQFLDEYFRDEFAPDDV